MFLFVLYYLQGPEKSLNPLRQATTSPLWMESRGGSCPSPFQGSPEQRAVQIHPCLQEGKLKATQKGVPFPPSRLVERRFLVKKLLSAHHRRRPHRSDQTIYLKVKVRNIEQGLQFRIYPNEEQRILMAKTFGCVRFAYNKISIITTRRG